MSRMNHEKRNLQDKLKKSKFNQRPNTAPKTGWVKLKNKYAATCGLCVKSIEIGANIFWNPDTKEVYHRPCLTNALSGKTSAPKETKPRNYGKKDNPFVAGPGVRGWRDIK